jgi:hypothetical protein
MYLENNLPTQLLLLTHNKLIIIKTKYIIIIVIFKRAIKRLIV